MIRKLVITKKNHNNKDIIVGAIIENDKLMEFFPIDTDTIIGNIYVGKIDKIINNINALFINAEGQNFYFSLNDNRDNIIFINNKKDKIPRVGDDILFQVTKEPVKLKQATAGGIITLTGKNIIIDTSGVIGISSKIKDLEKRTRLKAMLNEIIGNYYNTDINSDTNNSTSNFDNKHNFNSSNDLKIGGIVRTSAADVSYDEIENETVILLCKLNEIISKSNFVKSPSLVYKNYNIAYDKIFNKEQSYDSIITDMYDIYSYLKLQYNETNTNSSKLLYYNDKVCSLWNINNLEKEYLNIFKKNIYLKSGAYIVIEYTEAMTVIDVNSGKTTNNKKYEDNIFSINIEAAKEICRQLRIRNISGIIIVDFINMLNSDYNKGLVSILQEELQKDSIPAFFVDFTQLGLVEITRKKVEKPLFSNTNIIKYN